MEIPIQKKKKKRNVGPISFIKYPAIIQNNLLYHKK